MSLVAILGPTASGKSAIALELAVATGGTIISCDSMQVYRGLNIGTAKPSQEEQGRALHALIDIVDIHERFDLHRYIELAEAAIANSAKPIVCGGTGLYARTLFYGKTTRPNDPAVAEAVAAEFAKDGAGSLLAELRAVSPDAASKVADNPRHLCRAIVALRLGADPLPDSKSELSKGVQQFVLMPTPEFADQRIRQRTRVMLEAGWIEEVAGLVAQGLLESPTASQALGYRLIAEFSGDRQALCEGLVIQTRQYAKRQRTWFRHQHPGAEVLPIANSDDLARARDRILSVAR